VEYFPPTQLVQASGTAEPSVFECFPAEQSKQTVAEEAPAVVAYFPRSQLVQKSPDDAPSVSECFPAAQSKHILTDVAPEVAENLPLSQSIQTVEEATATTPNIFQPHNPHKPR